MNFLKQPALVILTLLLSTPAFAEQATKSTTQEALTKQARSAVKELAGGLKKQLKSALKSGGATFALPVCKTVAPSLAQEQSTRGPMHIRRTAIKLRNPQNAPDDFERRIMDLFTKKIKAGKPAASLEYSEIIQSGGNKLFRYMKAIPTAKKPCLACHGSNLKPQVQARIKELYPQDQATGFKAGELRGAFSVTQTLTEADKPNQ